MKKHKYFVVKIDGIDGAGKTTLILAIEKMLSSKFNIAVTKEFGSTQDIAYNSDLTVSTLLRDLAISRNFDIDDVERELLWAIISRRNNRIVLQSKLKNFDLVLVDRSNLGNLAYGKTLNKNLLCVFDCFTTPEEYADLYIWLDTPVEICMNRLENKVLDSVESKGMEFFINVREEYQKLYKTNKKIVRINGDKPLSELVDESIKVIEKHINMPIDR
jgi:dTMP kinase